MLHLVLHTCEQVFIKLTIQKKKKKSSAKEEKGSNSGGKDNADVTTGRTKCDRPECGGGRINQSSRAC